MFAEPNLRQFTAPPSILHLQRIGSSSCDPQNIVEEAELKPYVDEGWQFVSTLPSGKVLIRK
jgi:hypothetical protein